MGHAKAEAELSWSDQTAVGKTVSVLEGVGKLCCVVGVLYLFIIALGLMGDAFQILGGRSSGRTFRDSELLANPFAGVSIGILATVLMQSSSTTTSIIISMAASGLVTAHDAAYLVMGANIGTSVTNTLVSFAHINNAEEYRRAFTAAVFHDMFNWLTVSIFLPLEVSSGFLLRISKAIVDGLALGRETEGKEPEFLKRLTKPVTGRVVSVDKGLIEAIARAESPAVLSGLEKETIVRQSGHHLFRTSPISDTEVGLLLLFVSLAMLTTCLLMLVKLLASVLQGRVAIWTRYLLNLEFKHPLLRIAGGLDNYILLLFGTGATILVQSSSVFTSTLTPLVGIGLVHIEKMVPLTHGANIGTTVTGVLSALSGDHVDVGLRVALEHVLFNCLGTVVWFVVWPLRPVPLACAKFMGETAENLRWFPMAYVVGAFVGGPALAVGLAAAGWRVFAAAAAPLAAGAAALGALAFARRNRADLLPRRGCLSCLRAEALPCGCPVPNFARLWGGQRGVDEVDVGALREKEAAGARGAGEATPWPQAPAAWGTPQAPAAWGTALLSFFAVLVSVNSAQWYRMAYDEEPTGREDVGFGLSAICSEAFKGSPAFATPPPACDVPSLESCAFDLVAACDRDPSWATSSVATEYETEQYEVAWTRCSTLVGCRPNRWLEACSALPSCSGRVQHAGRCRGPLRAFSYFERLDAEAHGIVVDFSLSGTTDPARMPPIPSFYFPTTPANASAMVETYALPDNTAVRGIALDICSGEVHILRSGLSQAPCAEVRDHTDSAGVAVVRLQRGVRSASPPSTSVTEPVFTALSTASGSTLKGVPLDPVTGKPCQALPHNLPAVYSLHGLQIVDNETYLAADMVGSRVLVFDADGRIRNELVPKASGYAPGGGTVAVLPQEFFAASASQGIGAVALAQGKDRLLVCMRRPLDAASSVARCAVLAVDFSSGEYGLLAVKLLVLSSASSAILAAAWLEGADTALIVEGTSEDDFRQGNLLTADFSLGADVQNHASRPELLVDDAFAYPSHCLRMLVPSADPVPVTTRAEMLLGPSVAGAGSGLAKLSGVAVANGQTLVFAEDNAGAAAPSRFFVVNLPFSLRAEPPPACVPSGRNRTLRDGGSCRPVGEICPVGGLERDLAAVRGLLAASVTLSGLGIVLLVVCCLLPHRNGVRHFVFASAGLFFLALVLGVAGWSLMTALSGKEYGCIAQDESYRGGLVLLRGQLGTFVERSQAYGFMLVSWLFLIVPTCLVWFHVYERLSTPTRAFVACFEEAETATEMNVVPQFDLYMLPA
ncbi:hypothetical protein DIPPA_07814 [Diplonema papillatum]|nr:hypothetical protein DIPPA_07814 [Diplonema papillatum]